MMGLQIIVLYIFEHFFLAVCLDWNTQYTGPTTRKLIGHMLNCFIYLWTNISGTPSKNDNLIISDIVQISLNPHPP